MEGVPEQCNTVTIFVMGEAVSSQGLDNIALCFNHDHNITITNTLGPGKSMSLIEIQNITCLYSTTSLGSLCFCQMSCLLDLRMSNTTTCDEQQLEEFLILLTNSTVVNSSSGTFIAVSTPSDISNDTICLPPG